MAAAKQSRIDKAVAKAFKSEFPTATEFGRTLKRLKLPEGRPGDEALAVLLDVSRITVWRWRTGRTAVPKWAGLALEALISRRRNGTRKKR